jgi:hypothetical protein
LDHRLQLDIRSRRAHPNPKHRTGPSFCRGSRNQVIMPLAQRVSVVSIVVAEP